MFEREKNEAPPGWADEVLVSLRSFGAPGQRIAHRALPIVPLHRGTADGPWLVDWAECLNCGYEWVAVRPTGTVGMGLECPRCGEMDGQGAGEG